jgi:hypothetical protein
MQTLHGLHTDFMNSTQTLVRMANIGQTLHRLHTDSARTPHGLYEVHTDMADIGQTPHGLHMDSA